MSTSNYELTDAIKGFINRVSNVYIIADTVYVSQKLKFAKSSHEDIFLILNEGMIT